MVILDERNYLRKELEIKGFQVFDFFDSITVASVEEFCSLPLGRRADVLLVDTQTILQHPEKQEAFRTLLNTYLGVIFFHEQSNAQAQAWVLDQASFLTKIVGEYSLPMPQLNWTMLSNQLQFFWNLIEEQRNLQKHISQFSLELDQVLQTAEWEMTKAKKIHEVLIPRRSDEIKGVRFHNKYAAGEGGSGEFYDLHHTGHQVFQIFVSSQSYLISSALMGILNSHKTKDFQARAFLADAINEINNINGAKKKKSEVDILILETDLNELRIRPYGWTRAEVLSFQKGRIDLGLGNIPGSELVGNDYALSKDERLSVISPGFISNWQEAGTKTDILQFIQNHQGLALPDLLMELFFQIKKIKNTEFLSKDATVVMMEVNRHGIHQI
jgi:hypothetical protein